jgi:hypothetical protein
MNKLLSVFFCLNLDDWSIHGKNLIRITYFS